MAAIGAGVGAGSARPFAGATRLLGVARFTQVSTGLFRGAQPTRGGFERLRALGVRTIVNLRSFHSDRDDIAGLGFRYVHIYAQAWYPEDSDLLAFLRVVRSRRNRPVFVHCQHGVDRTGSVVAAYRMLAEGWSRERAVAEMRAFGYHGIWDVTIGRWLSALDVAELRRRLRAAPMPRVRHVP